MDHDRFDELTRWLASSASRRAAVRSLAAGALTTGLELRGREEAAATGTNAYCGCATGDGFCRNPCTS